MLSVKSQNKMVNLTDGKYMVLFLKSLNVNTLVWTEPGRTTTSIDGVDIVIQGKEKHPDKFTFSMDLLEETLNTISKPQSILHERFLGFKRLLEEQIYAIVNKYVYTHGEQYGFYYNDEIYYTKPANRDIKTDVYIKNKGNFDLSAASMYDIKEYIAECIVKGTVKPLSDEPTIFLPPEVMNVITPSIEIIEDYEENGRLVFRFNLVGVRTVHYSIDIVFNNKDVYPMSDELMRRVQLISKQCTYAYYARREYNLNKNLF